MWRKIESLKPYRPKIKLYPMEVISRVWFHNINKLKVDWELIYDSNNRMHDIRDEIVSTNKNHQIIWTIL